MTPRHWAELGGSLVLVVLAGVYVASREDRARMDATIAAQKEVIATAQKAISDAQADRAEHARQDALRDVQVTAQLTAMQQTIANLKTPQQQAAWSQQQLDTLIKGLTITTDKAGNATASIPAASLPDLPRVIEQCKECSVKLDKAQSDLQSRMQQQIDADVVIQNLKTQSVSLAKERDAAITAAKGGSFIKRAARTAKHVIIGAAIGAALVCGSGHCK